MVFLVSGLFFSEITFFPTSVKKIVPFQFFLKNEKKNAIFLKKPEAKVYEL